MKVLFAGTPQVAVAPLKHLAHQEDIEIVGVLTRPDAPLGRKRTLTPSPVAQTARELGLRVITANRVDADGIEKIQETGAQVGAVVAYGALLKPAALQALPLGWVNLHFSALPAWRGAAPVQRSLLAGETTAAATTFVLDEGMDTGPILRSFTEPVRADDVAGTVLERLSHLGAPVLADSLRDLVAGVSPTAQTGQATTAPKLSGADGRLDWDQPAEDIAARVRAVTPEPGAWTDLDGARFKITGHVVEDIAELRQEVSVQPGHVQVRDGLVLVGTGTQPVALTRVQPAGKKSMAATDWARGRLAGADTAEVKFS